MAVNVAGQRWSTAALPPIINTQPFITGIISQPLWSLLYCLNLRYRFSTASISIQELSVKNNFEASVFSLVFAIIVVAFNIIYAGGVSDSSSLASLIAPAADHQLRDSQKVYMAGWEQLAWLNDFFMHACVYMPQIVAVGS
ncbi:hypothetical protein WN943_022959 [Citrus x changshan-huyou]